MQNHPEEESQPYCLLCPPSISLQELLSPTMLSLSSKRLLYITFVIPLLLAMFVNASAVLPAKRSGVKVNPPTPRSESVPINTPQ